MQNDVGVLSLDLFNVNGSFKSINIANNSPGDFLQIADNLIWDILKLLLCWEDAESGRSVSGWPLVTGGCVTICRIRCEVLGVPPRCDGWGCYCGLGCPDTDIKIPPIPAQPSVHHLMAESGQNIGNQPPTSPIWDLQVAGEQHSINGVWGGRAFTRFVLMLGHLRFL